VDEINRGIQVMRVLKQLREGIHLHMHRGFKDMNLTAPQGMLIGILVHQKNIKISDLSEKLGLSNSTVSGIIDRLENQNMVERTRSSEDRRVVYVNITENFRKNFHDHFKKTEEIFQNILSKATEEELNKIMEGMETLQKVIERVN
jgi:DNA-binding MarR family transcriptional regulator